MTRKTGLIEVNMKGETVGWAVRDGHGEWTALVKGWPGEPGGFDVAYDDEHAQRIARSARSRNELKWRSRHYAAVDDLLDYVTECGGVRTPHGWWVRDAAGEWTFRQM